MMENLFNYIKENQFDSQWKLIETTIFLKENIIENQLSGSTDPRSSAVNSVYGEVLEVGNTYVIIKTKNSCKNPIIYTILYSKIIYIATDLAIDINIEICSTSNKNCLLIKSLNKNKDSNKQIVFIFNGIISNTHPVDSVRLLNDLVIIQNYFIIPINNIDGFGFVPNCNIKKEGEN